MLNKLIYLSSLGNAPRHLSFSSRDLSLVLMAHTRAPLEPLQLVAPKFLARKVSFLTLLASGARRGKLQAIMARSIKHDDKWKTLHHVPSSRFNLQDTTTHQRSPISSKAGYPSAPPSPRPGHVGGLLSLSGPGLKVCLANTQDKNKGQGPALRLLQGGPQRRPSQKLMHHV